MARNRSVARTKQPSADCGINTSFIVSTGTITAAEVQLNNLRVVE